MKKLKRILAVMMTIAMLLVGSNVVMAAETKVLYGNLSEPVLEVTNVIGEDNVFGIQTEYGKREVYLCQAPVTVTTAIDGICFFPAYQMIPVGNELYSSSFYFNPVGNVYNYDYDLETGETTKTIVPYDLDHPEQLGFVKGATITITKPGVYNIGALFAAVYEGVDGVYLNVVGDAQPTSSKVYVNGVETAFEAYNIADNNYFKIRDIAKVLSGTERQFNVTWDDEKQVIDLISNSPYTSVGGELSIGEMSVKTAMATASHMFKDGESYGFTSYTIGDNNYFLLRDLGEVFDFGVTWDEATQSIHIDTSKSYEKE